MIESRLQRGRRKNRLQQNKSDNPEYTLLMYLRDMFQAVVLLLLVIALPSVATSKEKDASPLLLREQAVRIVWRLVEETRASRQTAERERDIIDRKLGSILPLDAPKRGDDLRGMVQWYDEYILRLTEFAGEVDAEHGRLTAGGEVDRDRLRSFGRRLHTETKEMITSLHTSLKLFHEERGRLRQLIAQREIIDSRYSQLQEALRRAEAHQRDPQRWRSRQEDIQEAENIRVVMDRVRLEMLNAPVVREDVLPHYEGIIIQTAAELEWLQLKLREFQSLEALLTLTEDSGRAFMERLVDRFQQQILVSEKAVIDLNKQIDDLDTQRRNVVPFGSLRELDKSRELWDNYLERKRKAEEQIKRYKQLIGAMEADLSELQSELRR